ncbi:UNVERIFIED_ORG: hypothetical protein FHR35_001553 [Microbispora rosea subsp. rosea]
MRTFLSGRQGYAAALWALATATICCHRRRKDPQRDTHHP